MPTEKDGAGKSSQNRKSKSDTNTHGDIVNLMAGLDTAVGIWNGKDELVSFNEKFRALYSDFPDIRLGKTIGAFLLDFAKTGLVEGIKGKEEAWVNERLAERAAGLGKRFTYQTHDGRWISRIDYQLADGGIASVRQDISEQYSGREQLADKNSQLLVASSAINELSTALVIRDRSLRYRLVNRQFEAMYGKSASAVVGKTAVELFGAEVAAGFDPGNLDVIENGQTYQTDEKLRFPDGREIISHTEVKRIYGADNEPYACITMQDVTNLRQHETALAEKKSELALASAALGNLTNAVLVKDANLRYRLVNEKFCRILGKSQDELIGCTTREIFGEERAIEFNRRELAVIQTGEAVEFEETFTGADGVTIDSVTTIARIEDHQGNPYACIVVADVSEQVRQREELKAASQKAKILSSDLQSTIGSLDLGVVVVNRDLRTEMINDAFHRIWKTQPSDFKVNAPFRDLMDINRNNGVYQIMDEDWDAYVEQRLDGIREGNIQPTELLRADGVSLIYSVTNLSDDRRLISYFDISEQKAKELEVEEARNAAMKADRAKSEFLANMSHEIRTPMNGIMGMAELLAKTEMDARQKMFTDVIVKSGASLLTIINDILDFSKLDAGQMELDPAPFRLAEAIEDIATLVSSRVVEKDLELIVRVDPGLPQYMIGDVGRLRQIVTNLMGNAVKFTESGHVYVNVTGIGGAPRSNGNWRLRFEVIDTGIGIPADKCAAVFEKFSQVDNSSSRKHEGTGLGLAIASSLVKIMGGEIGVESQIGKGSTFWFEIELPADKEMKMKRQIPIDVTGARILIVDDNSVNRAILTEQMTAWNFDSAAAVDGAEALQIMQMAISQNITIDCVVLDYQMPGLNGGDVVTRMRAIEGLKDIPVIMLTSVDQTEDGKVFSTLGIQGHLIKPARSSHLLETIVSILHNSNFSRQALRNRTAEVKPEAPTNSFKSEIHVQNVSDAPQAGDIDILICEDNEVNQIVFTQILINAGLSFQIAGNGKIGVEMMARFNPKVILMDVSMPEMNGLEATAAIREIEKELQRHTPIIGVTAHAIKGDMEKCIAAGMDDYLSKPVSPDALQKKINHWLAAVEAVRRA